MFTPEFKRFCRWALGVSLALGAARLGLAQSEAASPVVYKVHGNGEKLELTIHSSRILTLDLKIPRVQVNNPDLLDVTALGPNQLQIYAKKAGVTQVNLWDENGQIHAIDVVIYGDARELSMTLASQFPTASIKVFPTSTSVILSGYVDQPDQVGKVIRVAEDYYPKIINNITVGGAQQILLHVKVMEISRTRLRTLGFDFGQFSSSDFLSSTIGGIMTKASTTTAINRTASAFSTTGNETMQLGLLNTNASFFGFIQALQQNNLVKIIAEPTLVAVSGRPAYFLDGGAVPYPIVSGLGSVNVSFRNYGTQVDFVPIVLGGGRVRLEIRPQVSEIDYSVAVTLNGTSVPGFTQRTVDTGVEMQVGQTLALAGLIQQRVETTKTAIPVLGDLPVVGAAFRFNTSTDNEIELLVLVRPEFAAGMDCEEVPPLGPGQNSEIPNNVDFYLHGYTEVPPYHPAPAPNAAFGPAGPPRAGDGLFGPIGDVRDGGGFEQIPPGQPASPGGANPPVQSAPPGQVAPPGEKLPPAAASPRPASADPQPARVSPPQVARPPVAPVSPPSVAPPPVAPPVAPRSAARAVPTGRRLNTAPAAAPARPVNPPQPANRQSAPKKASAEPPGFLGDTGYEVVK